MIKSLLTLLMLFTFGTSTVNAEENTTSIKDRISELTETKADSQSIINAEVDELSEDELKAVITNIKVLTEPTEDDLVIKEAAISKLDEMKSVETSDLVALGIGVLGLIFMLSTFFMMFTRHDDKLIVPIILGVLLIIVMVLLTIW